MHINKNIYCGNDKLDSAEIKEQELEILLKFDQFCKDFCLSYSLIGGTLLGAIRHHGFIPWDDDIDVGMPRPSYERLLSLKSELERRSNFCLEGYAHTKPEKSPYCKLLNPSIAVKADKEDRSSFLWIDIIPIDALPSDDHTLVKLYERVSLHQRVLMFLSSSIASSSSFTRSLLKVVTYPLRTGNFIVGLVAKRLNSLGHTMQYGSTPYVGVLTWGMYGTGERFSLRGLEQLSMCVFEGYEFPCMSCWHEYLTGIYGDYMTLPPKNKQVSHGLKAWYVEGKDE